MSVEAATLNHAGQQTQHTNDCAILTPILSNQPTATLPQLTMGLTCPQKELTVGLTCQGGPEAATLRKVWGDVGELSPSLCLQWLGGLVDVRRFEPHWTRNTGAHS